MPKKKSKSEEYKQEAWRANYREMVRKLQALSKVQVRQFLGTRVEGDPRVDYLTGLQSVQNMAQVQLQVLMDLATNKLGISREDFLKVSHDQLEAHLKSLQDDLCITGWDDHGNPTFNLPAYAERTKLWPL